MEEKKEAVTQSPPEVIVPPAPAEVAAPAKPRQSFRQRMAVKAAAAVPKDAVPVPKKKGGSFRDRQRKPPGTGAGKYDPKVHRENLVARRVNYQHYKRPLQTNKKLIRFRRE